AGNLTLSHDRFDTEAMALRTGYGADSLRHRHGLGRLVRLDDSPKLTDKIVVLIVVQRRRKHSIIEATPFRDETNEQILNLRTDAFAPRAPWRFWRRGASTSSECTRRARLHRSLAADSLQPRGVSKTRRPAT